MLHTQNTVFTLTVGYFFVELGGGVYYNSLALVTDAAFMAVNVMGQLIAILAARLSAKQPDARHPFGYERAKVLSGLVNGLLVGFVVFYVFVEAYEKVKHPEPIEAGKVLAIALVGLAVNGFGLAKLGDEISDMNVKGAYLHVLTDALGSVGVVVSCTVIHFTGLYIVDAVTGMIISLLVAYPTFFLVRDAAHVLMEGAPSGVSADDVRRFIVGGFEHVNAVKDLRIWSITPEKVVLAVRVRTDGAVYPREKVRSMKAFS